MILRLNINVNNCMESPKPPPELYIKIFFMWYLYFINDFEI